MRALKGLLYFGDLWKERALKEDRTGILGLKVKEERVGGGQGKEVKVGITYFDRVKAKKDGDIARLDGENDEFDGDEGDIMTMTMVGEDDVEMTEGMRRWRGWRCRVLLGKDGRRRDGISNRGMVEVIMV